MYKKKTFSFLEIFIIQSTSDIRNPPGPAQLILYNQLTQSSIRYLRTQVLNAQKILFFTFPPPKSPRQRLALRKTCKSEIGTRAFGYFDPLSEQKIDPF